MEVESDFEMILNYFEEFNIGEIFFIQLNVLTFDCLRRKTLFSIDFSNMFNCPGETSVRTNHETEGTSTSKKIQFMSMHYKFNRKEKTKMKRTIIKCSTLRYDGL